MLNEARSAQGSHARVYIDTNVDYPKSIPATESECEVNV